MGLLDDAVPGGNIAKPLLIALGVLLAGKMFAGKGGSQDAEEEGETPVRDTRDQPAPVPDRQAPQLDTRPRTETEPARKGGGSILDGLGDLLDNMANQGQKETADSWVKPGPNKPIEPDDLGKAIGDTTLRDLARRTGLSERELLEQLAKALPGVVDKLTPAGRVPDNGQIAKEFPSPW